MCKKLQNQVDTLKAENQRLKDQIQNLLNQNKPSTVLELETKNIKCNANTSHFEKPLHSTKDLRKSFGLHNNETLSIFNNIKPLKANSKNKSKKIMNASMWTKTSKFLKYVMKNLRNFHIDLMIMISIK